MDGPVTERLMSGSRSKLLGLDIGLMVCSGEDRVEGMVAACIGGYTTHIVTDAQTAKAMLDFSA